MNPLDVLARGLKINPVLTGILFGVPLVAAALALSLKLVNDRETAFVGAIVVLVLAVVTLLTAAAVKPDGPLKSTIVFFVRFCLALFMATASLTFTSVFFAWPRPLACLLRENCSRLAGNELNAQAPAVDARTPSAATAGAVVRSKYTVYIQFAGFSREPVAALRERLKGAGWNVPREERIGTAAGLFEVRYSSDQDKAAAEVLAAEIEQAQLSRRQMKLRRISIIRPGTLEVWISQ